jgi:peptidoglycan hydrolase-like protein with peptidoglycan-binding domain
MGPLTRKAVIAFQRAYPPLAADGVPGPRTQAKLVEVCGY